MEDKQPDERTFIVFRDIHSPSELTSEEFVEVVIMGGARASFPYLCDQFAVAATDTLLQRIDRVDELSSDEDWKSAGKINSTLLKMHMKASFHMAAMKVLPELGGFKARAERRFEAFNFRAFNTFARLLNDDLGPYRASQILPSALRREVHADISDGKAMPDLAALIRYSLKHTP